MEFTVNDVVYRFANRDIILVSLDSSSQPMYRSTGINSGMPGSWLPFDGIAFNGTWFDKTSYCRPVVSSEFHRFGNQELKDLSEALGNMDIPVGQVAGHPEINGFLSYHSN